MVVASGAILLLSTPAFWGVLRGATVLLASSEVAVVFASDIEAASLLLTQRHFLPHAIICFWTGRVGYVENDVTVIVSVYVVDSMFWSLWFIQAGY